MDNKILKKYYFREFLHILFIFLLRFILIF